MKSKTVQVNLSEGKDQFDNRPDVKLDEKAKQDLLNHVVSDLSTGVRSDIRLMFLVVSDAGYPLGSMVQYRNAESDTDDGDADVIAEVVDDSSFYTHLYLPLPEGVNSGHSSVFVGEFETATEGFEAINKRWEALKDLVKRHRR